MLECPRCRHGTRVISSMEGYRKRKCRFCGFAGMTEETWNAKALREAGASPMTKREEYNLAIQQQPVAASSTAPPEEYDLTEWRPGFGKHPAVRTAEDNAWDAYVLAGGAMERVAWLLAGKPVKD